MFTTIITPRVSETDGAGHINNTVAPVWLESGRHEIFRMFSPDLAFDDWHVALVNWRCHPHRRPGQAGKIPCRGRAR